MCDTQPTLLASLVDGEVTGDDRDALDAHLQHCAPCRARLERDRALKHAISRLPAVADPPEAVLARIQALQFDPTTELRWQRGLWSGVALAAVTVVVLAIGFAGRPPAWPSLTQELIADYLRYAPEALPGEVAAGDPAAVGRFFAGQVPFEPVGGDRWPPIGVLCSPGARNRGRDEKMNLTPQPSSHGQCGARGSSDRS